MSAARVGRYVKMTARPGQGAALADLMIRVAAGLDQTPGCDLYVVNRSLSEPDTVWVTELWRSQTELDASLEDLRNEAGKAQLGEVMALLAGPPDRIDVEPLGGVGFPSD